MSLHAGTRLGPYEVIGAIGAGGMGEVYQARDTRLKRTVAIKVLPPEMSSDPQRLRRLEREAHSLASLSHPRICALFDIGEHQGSTFLVMEHIEGDTLAERLKRGLLPLAQALEIAAQIAEGLDAAHRRGIVHRDLKPGNVMLTRSGAKVLDFGLAKLRSGGELDRNASTEAEPLTGAGAVLGTLQYMAPEQLEGKEVDARADLWALGAILYEMASGSRPFSGSSSASLMASILEREPRPLVDVLPIAPPSLDRVVRRCLAKHPDERWESARDLADNLRWIAQDIAQGEPAASQAAARPKWRRALPVAAGTAIGLLLGAGALWVVRPAAAPAPQPMARALLDVSPADEVRSAMAPRGETRTPGGSLTAFAWTPDGRSLVFAGTKNGAQQLFVRSLDGDEAKPLPGTEGAHMPVVSPDGEWVAFWADGAIRKAPLARGPATVIADKVDVLSGMDWGATGLLAFDQWRGGIWRVRPGSSPEVVTKIQDRELEHMHPRLLPGDTVVLFTVRKRVWTWGDEEVVAQSLLSGKRTVLLHNAADARYVHPGRLLFMRQGKLLAVPFDPATLEVKGEQVTILDGVAQALTASWGPDVTGAGQLAVSSGGALAYIASPLVPFADRRLVTVDRSGRIEPLGTPARTFAGSLNLSPDGRRLAVRVHSLDDSGLWIYELARGTLTPLTPNGGEAVFARWAPNGRHVAFDWLRSGVSTLAWQQTDGSAPPEILFREALRPSSWAPDGRGLAVLTQDGRIDVLDVGVSPPQLRPLAEPPVRGFWPTFSPDGRWLAYGSTMSSRFEVYLQPYPGPGPRVQVSVNGGTCPAWNPNGRELFFLAPVDPLGERLRMMSADVALGATVTLGKPRPLFEFRDSELNLLQCWPVNCYAVASDGQHFLTMDVVRTDPPPPVTHINLVLNWRAELEAKVPSGL